MNSYIYSELSRQYRIPLVAVYCTTVYLFPFDRRYALCELREIGILFMNVGQRLPTAICLGPTKTI